MNNLFGVSKKQWIILIGTALIVVAFIILNFLDKGADLALQQPFEAKTEKINDAQLPKGLPATLPSEIGSQVLRNYEVYTNDGRLQATREVTTKKEARAALDFYVDFFKTQGYEGQFDEAMSSLGNQKVARMLKGNDLLMIVVRPYQDKQNKIEISLTQIPK